MAINVNDPRWKGSISYLKALPLAEKRRFFSKTLKYMLNDCNWDDSLRPPVPSDHENMRSMIVAFNDHSQQIMREKKTPDIKYQWQIVRSIKKGKKSRVRKKQITRLTREFMMIIRMCHPVKKKNKMRLKDRVKCMPNMQREVKKKYFQ